MVTRFDTTGNPSKSGGSTNMILIVLGLGALAYGYYRFVYLPKQKKEEEVK
jgi:hypothetical protein